MTIHNKLVLSFTKTPEVSSCQEPMVSLLKKSPSANFLAVTDPFKVVRNAITSRNGLKEERKLISDKSDMTPVHQLLSHILYSGNNGRENSSGIWTVLSPVKLMDNRDSLSQVYTNTFCRPQPANPIFNGVMKKAVQVLYAHLVLEDQTSSQPFQLKNLEESIFKSFLSSKETVLLSIQLLLMLQIFKL